MERPNRAVTSAAPVSFTLQGRVPLHAPLKPVKSLPESAVAVSLTDEPSANEAEQVVPAVPQRMPSGSETTPPVPSTVTVIVGPSKVAVTAEARFIRTSQAPEPVQSPD